MPRMRAAAIALLGLAGLLIAGTAIASLVYGRSTCRGAWALDSEESGFEKMEAGLNARAIDSMKSGQLYLEGGAVDGVQVVPEAWVAASV